ncbi:hypothetical protein MTQ12_13615 [Brevibacterium sp. R8603A2]|uniref:hypothetical protein n=1 Tax=Brevibacterium sp. R8603A2 TaxID=2929779 RepID=UPI001FF79DAD|nr:hypothetical protein [Brevibacterium sp. R8603A2]MCK1804074.1 hypothetical protein [Brevibacterium sp. R8603A2]
MSRLFKPCITCGLPGPDRYCPEHTPARRMPKESPRKRGYDSTWDRLSIRARKAQPFCLDCGRTDDLTTDHSAEAWERYEQGKVIRLEDVAVRCRSCNSMKGDPRNTRPVENAVDRGDEGLTKPQRTPGARHTFSYTPRGYSSGEGGVS